MSEFKFTAFWVDFRLTKSNFLEENSKIGLSGGVGISMFLLEIMANYNYFQTNQYVSIDLKVRIPLYVAF